MVFINESIFLIVIENILGYKICFISIIVIMVIIIIYKVEGFLFIFV